MPFTFKKGQNKIERTNRKFLKNNEQHIDPFKAQFGKLADGELPVNNAVYNNVMNSIPASKTGFSNRVINTLGKKNTVRLLILSIGINLLTLGYIIGNWTEKPNSNININLPKQNISAPISSSIQKELKPSAITTKEKNYIDPVEAKKVTSYSNPTIISAKKPNSNPEIETPATLPSLKPANEDTLQEYPENESSIEIAPIDSIPTPVEIEEEKDPKKYGLGGLQVDPDSAELIKIWKKKK